MEAPDLNSMDQGLLYRVKRAARHIGEQHAHIGEIFRTLESAIARGDAAAARQGFERYSGAIDAHFSLEDRVFFPALHGLHPEHAKALEDLTEEHRGFLAELDRLGRELDAGLERFGAGLAAIALELSVHESREERLVRELGTRPPATA